MKKFSRFFVLVFLIILTLYASCSFGPQEFGVLEGQVTIGPLVPVVREGEEPPTPAPEVFEARMIVVFKKNGSTEFTHLRIDPSGHYNARLPVGIYIVDINHLGIDSAAGLPKQVEINANSVTTLDIDIDTGIR